MSISGNGHETVRFSALVDVYGLGLPILVC